MNENLRSYCVADSACACAVLGTGRNRACLGDIYAVRALVFSYDNLHRECVGAPPPTAPLAAVNEDLLRPPVLIDCGSILTVSLLNQTAVVH